MTHANVLIPTPEQTDQAKELVPATPGTVGFFVDASGRTPLPPEISSLLTRVLETLASGGSLTISAMPEDLTTTQAARLLGESRPTLMKRIRNGELGSSKAGTHHRLKTEEVLALRRKLLEERREAARRLLALEDEFDF